MEQFRPRLLRTYAGPRGRRAGLTAAAALSPPAAGPRRLPAWISPKLDPRHLFSSSSSSSLASPASPDDPDFKPCKRKSGRRAPPRRKAPRRGGGSRGKAKTQQLRDTKEEEEEEEEEGDHKENQDPLANGPLSVTPRTPLWRNVTFRRHRGIKLSHRPPLLCSTPQLVPQAAREAEEAGVPQEIGCEAEEVLGGASRGDVRLEQGFGVTDGDNEGRGSILKLASCNSVPGLWQTAQDQGDWTVPLSIFRRHFSCMASYPTSKPGRPWTKIRASLRSQEELTLPTAPYASRCLPPSPGTARNHGRLTSPKIESVPLNCSQGVLQLHATVSNDTLMLFDTPLRPHKRQHVSVHSHATLEKIVGDLNGILSVEGSNCSIDQTSPRLQPVVCLDRQAVQKWLASNSSKKQAAVPFSQVKSSALPSESPCTFSGVPNLSRRSQAVLARKAGESSRRACISGFSSNRWRQHGKQLRVKKKQKQKQMDSFLTHKTLKRKKPEENLDLSPLSPDASLKNYSLWRRIRASFSLQKKKIILTEGESFNSSSVSVSSVGSHFKEVLKTPFTQKLCYSICPSSSLVQLSTMTCFSTSDVILSDAEKVYRECQQKGPISFEDCISPDQMQKCEKVGEGVFGEVFRTVSEMGPVALKIIPIEGTARVNGEPQKTFSTILPEIIISKELSLLANEDINQTSGFISLHSVHCVQGSYPNCLLDAWDRYHRLKESENNRPDFFEDHQLFMVLEFEFGGIDLENMRNRKLNSVIASRSILHQVTASLAVAEEALHFEHRDLHWGNILIKKTDLKEVSFTLKGETHKLPTEGILINIIDYTFSRLEKDSLTVYLDLSSDEEVFQGKGDYQFDIYRQMKEENANYWADYFPHSNVLWLHYLADKLLKEVCYRKKPTTSSMKYMLKQLKQFANEILSFRSATDTLYSSQFFQ